jgi:Cu(I)/Ag(I) efflux system protein CusF
MASVQTSIQRKFTMKRSATLVLFVALSAVVPTVSFGQAGDLNKKGSSAMDMKDMGMNKKAATTTHKGVGVIKDINAADGVVTLAHEPIKSLNWPAMTMAFKVKDKSLMDKIKPGDKVEFTLVQVGKDYLITRVK